MNEPKYVDLSEDDLESVRVIASNGVTKFNRLNHDTEVEWTIWAVSHTETPIEALFLSHFMATSFKDHRWSGYVRPKASGEEPNITDEFVYQLGKSKDGIFVNIYSQAHIGDYRVDFVVIGRVCDFDEVSVVVVECDGHEFHEKTREQAQRDKARDRALQLSGFRVLRFTGSEIYNNGQKCAEEVKNHLVDISWSQLKLK